MKYRCMAVFIFSITSNGAGADAQLLDLRGLEAGDEIPTAWQPLEFSGLQPTPYRLMNDPRGIALCGFADASASGLVHRFGFSSKRFPELSWEWKVDNVYQQARIGEKAGDDFPARIYISFQYQPEHASWATRMKFESYHLIYDEYPPIAVLNYVWASEEGVIPETIVTSPYSDRSKMLVVRSGQQMNGQWVSETRDIAADYRRAFAAEPPPITAIALMSDADNTGEKSSACYRGIRLLEN